VRVEECAAQGREVGDEDARVEFALEKAETGVFEACFAQALEAETLVNVGQFLRLAKVYLNSERWGKEGRRTSEASTTSLL
jgi:hypothetical protein